MANVPGFSGLFPPPGGKQTLLNGKLHAITTSASRELHWITH